MHGLFDRGPKKGSAIIPESDRLTTTLTSQITIADIVVPGPFQAPLSYLLPNADDAQPGIRVRVPLRSRSVVGMITNIRQVPEEEAKRLKPIEQLLDESPLIPSHLLAIAEWISRYYLYDAHNAYLLTLPATLRSGEAASLNEEERIELTVAGKHLEPTQLKGERQQQALDWLQKNGPATPTELRVHHIQRPHWQGLVKKRLAKTRAVTACATTPSGELKQTSITLNEDQNKALTSIAYDQFNALLLEGVTGSGKTEVYLQAMETVLKAGKRVLVLVPEIGLTPQTLARFQQRFADSLVALHSGLNDRQRHNAWLRAQSGEAAIILGTRSAVMTPIPDLGLIVVDEEHDASFKQQDTLRYHARDVAIYRARQLGIPILLGSATPSLESLHNARNGRYRYAQLHHRAQGQHIGRLETIDMRRQQHQDGLSERLLHRVHQHLASGNQVLLFLNRRGYAPSWFCSTCGWMADCPFCDARLTYHRSRHMTICHHCGYQDRPPTSCPDCGSQELMPMGAGTERAEEALQSHFANTPIIRFDRDAITSAKTLDEQLARAHQDGPAILVGTQMLAKGHHFERVTLVGILDMDAGLFSADFRARERMGQLLIQVAGRAGRGTQAGEVMLQSWHPDHPFFEPLLNQDYTRFADQLLSERERSGLPPFGYLACLRSDSAFPKCAEEWLAEMAQRLLATGEVRVFGPLPAILSRRAGKHRFILLVQSQSRSRLHAVLEPLVRDYPRQSRHISWHLDIDPIDLM